MVSPSKHQQHCQQQSPQHDSNQQHVPRKNGETSQTTKNAVATTGAPAAAAHNVHIIKGPKPLKNKIFYLDIKNHAYSAKLEAKIKELGGAIELFLLKNVSLVITDRSDRSGQATASDRRKWGYASGGSGGPPSLRSIEVQTPTPTPPTPYCSVEGPLSTLSNSTNHRGQTTQRSKSRVDAMLERALTQPQQCSVDPLQNALSWGLPIWSTYELQAWLDKITASLKDSNSFKRDNRTGSGKDLKVKHLKEPYIKFESYRRESRPVFLELQSWPTLNFDGDPGSCPFDLKRREKKEVASNNKEIKENRQKYFNPNISKGKDMTRRPRATATRARKTENTGYCEICRIDYRNLSKHLQSDQHLNFVRNDKNFLSLDNLISTGASVEAFLEINRSKDVSKDCNIFNRDHSLDNGILSLDEKLEKRDKPNLGDFNIEEMKMMQCNGARRNLNLKLDSPHNLRTRAKHESGHLLRSKGRPWHEEEKGEKLYDKYTIKKRAKGTIWIEEDDSEEEKDLENSRDGCDGKTLFERICEPDLNKNATNREKIPSENVSVNGDIDSNAVDYKLKENSLNKVTARENSFRDSLLDENLKTKVNGYERKEEKPKINEVLNSVESQELKEVNNLESNTDSLSRNNVDNIKNSERLAPNDNEDTNSLKSFGKDDRGKYKLARRGGRSYRGRQRLSVEERLIEDNRDYYKVEVLGNKLRSSAIPSSNVLISPLKEQVDRTKKDEKSSSEKPVVVRFKRVRKSELSLLSDEAESFMFGDARRDDDSSENSDGEQSSVLPKDTESDRDENASSLTLSSSPVAHITPKQETIEDDSQDSSVTGRARKRRRTQTEALIKDNTDYYKFETPGSRLRYQAPLTGICDPVPDKDAAQPLDPNTTEVVEKIYPSKPSPEIEKMHFSFEAVPKSEPWYQTYQRQDEGAEFWHYFSESDTPKPFLLPYEIENFHEILHKSLQSSAHRKRGRGRGGHANLGSRSPRKSPRCHASTLAIMSTIIRRREQQQTTTLHPIEEEVKVKPISETAKSEKKCSEKSDIDEDLKEIVKNLDDMLSSNDMHDMESFEVDLIKNVDDAVLESEVQPKGAPVNLLELLDHCHETIPPNGIENSSCASSECGEFYNEFPLKKRKKRKNKTGWPGNKMRRKLHIKHLSEELQRELELERSMEMERSERKSISLDMFEDTSSHVSNEDEGNELEQETGKENERIINLYKRKGNRRRTKGREVRECRERLQQEGSEIRNAAEGVQSKMVLKSVFGDEIPSRKNRSESSDKFKVDEDEVETHLIKDLRHLDSKGTLSSISEDSEASLSNNENLCTKDTNSLLPHEKHSPPKYTRKRQRKNTTSSEPSHHPEAENRRLGGVGTASRKQQQQQQQQQQQKQNSSENQNLPLSIGKKDRRRPSKYQRNNRSPSTKVIFDDENRTCKKQSFLSLKERRRLKRVRSDVSVSSELQNGELDCALSERVSPSLVSSSDMDQRRSSIDFQPVVRVMKIEDQVDMDNSILSVAVASNRRLRSSSSPRLNMQPPNKRFRNGSGRRQFSGQWIKNS